MTSIEMLKQELALLRRRLSLSMTKDQEDLRLRIRRMTKQILKMKRDGQSV